MQALRGRQRYNYLQTGTERRWVVSTMLCLLSPRKNLVFSLQEAGWALGPTWMAQKISPSLGFNCCAVQPTVISYNDYVFPTY